MVAWVDTLGTISTEQLATQMNSPKFLLDCTQILERESEQLLDAALRDIQAGITCSTPLGSGLDGGPNVDRTIIVDSNVGSRGGKRCLSFSVGFDLAVNGHGALHASNLIVRGGVEVRGLKPSDKSRVSMVTQLCEAKLIGTSQNLVKLLSPAIDRHSRW